MLTGCQALLQAWGHSWHKSGKVPALTELLFTLSYCILKDRTALLQFPYLGDWERPMYFPEVT